jgi:hypothetical protein
VRFRSDIAWRKERKSIEYVSEQAFGKTLGTKWGGVSVGRTALQFVLFVKCYVVGKVKEGAIYVAPKARWELSTAFEWNNLKCKAHLGSKGLDGV